MQIAALGPPLNLPAQLAPQLLLIVVSGFGLQMLVLDAALCVVQSVVLHGGFKWVKYCEYRSSKLYVHRYGAYKRCSDHSFSEEPQKMGRGTPAEISRKVSSHFCSPGPGVKQSRDHSG